MKRRTFLKLPAVIAATSFLPSLPAIAKPKERAIANDLTVNEYQAVKQILMTRVMTTDPRMVRWGLPIDAEGQMTALHGHYHITFVYSKTRSRRLYFEANRNFAGDYRDNQWLEHAVLDLKELYNANRLDIFKYQQYMKTI